MVRRTVGFFLTVILTVWAGYQLAWHKDLRDRITDHPLQSLGLLVLALIAVALFGVLTVRHSAASAPVGLVFGIGVAVWGSSLFEGIKWATLGWLAAVFVGVAVLWMITVLGDLPLRGRLSATQRGTRRSPGDAGTTSVIQQTPPATRPRTPVHH